MSCNSHGSHDHKHGTGCGHTAVQHDDHTDYVHEGHLHHMHDDHVDEHTLSVSNVNVNASSCTPAHICEGHEKSHKHGAGCGHEAIPHGDHVDYIVNGHLHRACGDHCDDHGKV